MTPNKDNYTHLGLVNVSLPRVAEAGVTAMDRLQNYQPVEQVAALSTLLLLLTEVLGVEAQDIFTAVRNMLASPAGKESTELLALRAYLGHEL